MPDFRKGTAALKEAQANKGGGGSFRSFAPFISWADDQDERYLLFLNEWEDMPQVDYIGFIDQTGEKQDGSKYTYTEAVIARTDPAIGEDTDPLVEEWDAKPRLSHVAVAVELEPEYAEVRGRKRPSGFSVKTDTFSRRVRDDQGNLTDESEEVTAPVVGFIVQSPHNFFNVVQSYDLNEAPIHEVPVKITRVGAKKSNSTTYTITGYDNLDVDLSELIDNAEFISYLGDDVDDVLAAIEEAEDDQAAGLAIGNFMLDRRLTELCDKERYDKIAKGVTASLDKFGNKGNKGGKSKDEPKKSRPTQRRSRKAKDEEPAPEAEAPVEEADAPEEDDSDAKDKLKKLRAQARKRRAGSASAA